MSAQNSRANTAAGIFACIAGFCFIIVGLFDTEASVSIRVMKICAGVASLTVAAIRLGKGESK